MRAAITGKHRSCNDASVTRSVTKIILLSFTLKIFDKMYFTDKIVPRELR